MAHNISYGDGDLDGTLTPSLVTGSDLNDIKKTGAQNYTDIFIESTSADMNMANCGLNDGKGCVVKCSCNTDNGWYASQPSSGSYVTATSTRKYAYVDTPSARTFAAAASSAPKAQTCYKSTCPSGYFADMPDTNYFTTNSSTVNGKTCYQTKGCITGYTYYTGTSPYNKKYTTSTYPAAEYAPQGTKCWKEDKYFLDVYYKFSNYGKRIDLKCTNSYSGASQQHRLSNPSNSLIASTVNCTIGSSSYGSSGNASYQTILNGTSNGYTTTADQDAFINNTSHSFSIGSKSISLKIAGNPVDTIENVGKFTLIRHNETVPCPSGYYEDIPTSAFDYDTSTSNGKTCYKVKGCKASYGNYYTSKSSTRPYAYYKPQNVYCNLKECKCDVTVSTSLSAPAFGGRPYTVATIKTGLSAASGYICGLSSVYKQVYVTYPYRAPTVGGYMSISSSTRLNGTFEQGARASIGKDSNSDFPFQHDWIPDGYTRNSNNSCTIQIPDSTTTPSCPNGYFDKEPNTSFFQTASSAFGGKTCYRVISCNPYAGAHSEIPNTSFFKTVSSFASGSTCYRGAGCNTNAGAHTDVPDVQFFNIASSAASGVFCYIQTGCKYTSGNVCNTYYGKRCCKTNASSISTSYFTLGMNFTKSDGNQSYGNRHYSYAISWNGTAANGATLTLLSCQGEIGKWSSRTPMDGVSLYEGNKYTCMRGNLAVNMPGLTILEASDNNISFTPGDNLAAKVRELLTNGGSNWKCKASGNNQVICLKENTNPHLSLTITLTEN